MRTALLIALAMLIAACAPQAAPGPSGTSAPPPASTREPVAPTEPAPPSPTAAPTPTPLPTGAAPMSIRFVDPLHGWMGTDDGILGTADGGTTWDRQLTSGSITKLWAYDRTRAWALAGLSALYRTEDGSHWTPIADLPFPLIVELQVFSPGLVFAIGVAPAQDGPAPVQRVGRLMRSDDGGTTWQVAGTRTLWSACFDTPTSGIGADGKQIFRTANAGQTWTLLAELQIADDGPWYPSLTCADATSASVQVTEPRVGLGHAAWLMFRTGDSGATWALEYREGYTLGSITPPNTPGLGSYPSLIGTLTRSRTWILTCTPAADVQELRIVDERHGWAVATIYQLNATQLTSTRIIMRTTDGRTWDRIYPAVVRS